MKLLIMVALLLSALTSFAETEVTEDPCPHYTSISDLDVQTLNEWIGRNFHASKLMSRFNYPGGDIRLATIEGQTVLTNIVGPNSSPYRALRCTSTRTDFADAVCALEGSEQKGMLDSGAYSAISFQIPQENSYYIKLTNNYYKIERILCFDGVKLSNLRDQQIYLGH